MLFLTPENLVAARDPSGFRPLVIGRLGNSYVVASESCAFELIGAEYLREVEPGEIIFINDNGLQSFKPFPEVRQSSCVFELIYFART